MARRWPFRSASVVLLVATLSAPPARALDEREGLRLVGERAFADGRYPLARRVLERFVAEYPNGPHAGSALFLLGRARFALGDTKSALEAFRRAQAAISPAEALEAKFWEAETLFRLRRFPEARAAYDAVVKTDAAAPRAPEALYGLAWSDLELGRPETAIAELRELLARWPDHALVPSATLHLARTLAEQKRFGDALPLLEGFATKYPNHKQLPDAQYLLGWARVKSGDTKRSEEHTFELQSQSNLVCRLLLEKKKTRPSTSAYSCAMPMTTVDSMTSPPISIPPVSALAYLACSFVFTARKYMPHAAATRLRCC